MNLLRFLAFAILAFGVFRFVQGIRKGSAPVGRPSLDYEPLKACSSCGVRVPISLSDSNGLCRDCAKRK